MSSTRRTLLAGLALPAAACLPNGGTASAATTADPHLAHAAETLALWRAHKATEWGWGAPYGSPASEAADAAHWAVLDHAKAAASLPPPTTPAGLGALALTYALAHEGYFTHEGGDMSDRCFGDLLRAVLAITGTVLPEGFGGLMNTARAAHPDAALLASESAITAEADRAHAVLLSAGPSADYTAASGGVSDSLAAVAAIPATTMAGAIVKARLAATHDDDRLAEAVVSDLVAIGGGLR